MEHIQKRGERREGRDACKERPGGAAGILGGILRIVAGMGLGGRGAARGSDTGEGVRPAGRCRSGRCAGAGDGGRPYRDGLDRRGLGQRYVRMVGRYVAALILILSACASHQYRHDRRWELSWTYEKTTADTLGNETRKKRRHIRIVRTGGTRYEGPYRKKPGR